VKYYRKIFVVAGLLFLAFFGKAQHTAFDWRKAPDSSLVSGVLQVQLTPAFFERLDGGDLPLQGASGFGEPTLDSLWQQFGFESFKKVIFMPLKPSKEPRLPQNTPVLRWVQIKLRFPKMWKAALEALENQKQWVSLAEPLYRIVLYGAENPFEQPPIIPNDTLFNAQWHYNNTGQTGGTVDADIDLPEAWDLERGKPGVIVAIMDNGIDTTHPDLRQNIWSGRGFNFFNNQPGLIPGSHGNHVSGSIAAVNDNISFVSGIAGGDGSASSGVRLMSCQIFGAVSGSGGVENAFVYSADNGAAISHNSWGYASPDVYNQSVIDAIDYFIEKGGGGVLKNGLVIFSGGNQNGNIRFWPGVYHKVIGVTATNHRDLKSWYSTYHEYLDIAAPGGETNSFAGGSLVQGGRQGILSTFNTGNGLVGYLQGTSMAAPQVSGVAALIASKASGRLSADDVKSLLINQADPIDNLNAVAFQGKLGIGRLNAFKALQKTAQLAAAPSVEAPVRFSGEVACSDIVLTWKKNNSNQEVMLAVSVDFNRGGLFGIPSGALQPGANIPGGGKVLYRGNGDGLTLSGLNADSTYFFKLWTVLPADNYSMGLVLKDFLKVSNLIESIEANVDCYDKVNISWQPFSNCFDPEVLLAYSAGNQFAIPTQNLQTGDNLGNGALIIYRGKASQFNYNLTGSGENQSHYFRIWPVLPNGKFGTPLDKVAVTPEAIQKVVVGEITKSSIEITWLRSNCFEGDVLVAYNTTTQFGTPLPGVQTGGQLAGGGRILYRGTTSSTVHDNLAQNSRYFYAVWPVVNGKVGNPKIISAYTDCIGNGLDLPFMEGINESTFENCRFDTLGIRNFTAGPLPAVSVVTDAAYPLASPYSGAYMLRFNSYDTREGNQVLMTTPKLSTINVPSVDVQFKWYEDGSDYNTQVFLEEKVSLFWSTDRTNWQPVITFTRLPAYGKDGWKIKQATLPAAAGNQPALYLQWVFKSAWGFDCYLDEIEIAATRHRAPNGAFHPAVAQFKLADGFTNYYDSTGNILLSINDGGPSLGHVEDQLKVGIGGQGTPVLLPATGNYVRNPGGWLTDGAFYFTSGWNNRAFGVTVRQFLPPTTFEKLQSLGAVLLNPASATLDSSMLYAYQLHGVGGLAANPVNGHSGIPVSSQYNSLGFWQLHKGNLADSLFYKTAQLPGLWKAIETRITQPGSGGVGIGSITGNGALSPNWISLTASRNTNRNMLNWTTGYERRWIFMDIERQDPNSSNFAFKGTRLATGLPQSGNTYSWTDDDLLLPNGIYRYRIRATDASGKVYISPEATVLVENVKGVVIFPNPVTSSEMVVYSENPLQSLRLVDALGRVVLQLIPTGTAQRILVGKLPNGVYFLQAGMDNQTITKKLLIAH